MSTDSYDRTMEPNPFSPETRKHPVAHGFDTVPPQPGVDRRAPSPQTRPATVAAVVVVAGALIVFAIGFVYRLGLSHGTPKAPPPSASSSAVSTRVLLLDPVCRKAVDPSTAPAVLDFGGKSIYFDTLECLNAFRTDPVKYGAGRVRVHIAPNAEPSAVAPNAPADGTEGLGNVPSAPTDVPASDTAPAPAPEGGTLDEEPVTEAPLDAPGETPPTTGDAPPVTESSPSDSVPDMPRKAPSRPSAGDPKKAPPAPPPDENGFSLPPELKEGPPPRTGGGRKPAPAATEGPPSVEENPPPP